MVGFFSTVITLGCTKAALEDEESEGGVFSVIKVGASGVLRGMAGLPIEHPFDVVKTRWQAHPEFKSSWRVARDVFDKKGVKGFYSGVGPNGFRMGFKQAYRWPLMIFLPGMYADLIDDPYKQKIATGLTIANLEVGIINPLERLKVWLMTNNQRGSGQIFAFMRENREHMLQSLFKGTSATLPKQNVSWVSFLAADEFLKRKMQAYRGTKDLGAMDGLVVGSAVGVINTFVTLPLDCIKTTLQECGGKSTGFFSAARDISTNHGIKGFYAGWKPRIVQYIIHAALTSNMLAYFEKRYTKKEK